MSIALEKSLKARNVRFTNTLYDNSELLVRDTAALEYLMLQYIDGNEDAKTKLFASLRSAIQGGNEPAFDVGHTWPYPIIISCFLLARRNEKVWGELTEEEHERIDCLMEAFAYMTHLAIADNNNFRTGLRLRGNYFKNWAPNYQLANIPHINLIAEYFSGAKNLNEMYLDYNHDEFVAKLQKYNFVNALKTFGREGYTTDDGLYVPSAEEMLTITDCQTYVLSTQYGYTNVSDGGKGKGIVRHFSYNGLEADNLAILEGTLNHTHSGGVCETKTGTAYPNAEGETPSAGLEGMFLELNLPTNKRYSAFYSKLDFVMEVGIIAALERVTDWRLANNEELNRKVTAGNADLIWKLSEGFNSVNSGKPQGVHYADNEYGYLIMKELWETR